MDILRNLLGSLTSGIIRLAVTAGILAAVYFFVLKPVLHTTGRAIEGADRSLERSLGTEGASLTEIERTLEEVSGQIRRQVHKAFDTAPDRSYAHRLVRCIQRAGGNAKRIERCAQRH